MSSETSGFRKTPHPTICLPQAEEETDQVVLRVPHGEELVHWPHGREVRVATEGGIFDNMAGVAQITEIKEDDDPEKVEAPQDPEQDF